MKKETKSLLSQSIAENTQKTRWIPQMFRIVLCDDDQSFIKNLSALIEKSLAQIGQKCKIHTFTAMEQISDQLLSSCDIAFLDIDFTGKPYNGLDIARRLRKFRTDSVIIFVTNYVEYAPEGYEVQAFRYVLKSDVASKLDGYLQQGIQKLEQARETMKIQINGEIIDIPLNDILYIESQLHSVNVYVQRKAPHPSLKVYTFYASISNLEQQLEPQGFLRVHKSYLVNMRHIRRYQCQEVELSNGAKLSASETRYAAQKKKYLLWKGNVVNG